METFHIHVRIYYIIYGLSLKGFLTSQFTTQFKFVGGGGGDGEGVHEKENESYKEGGRED